MQARASATHKFGLSTLRSGLAAAPSHPPEAQTLWHCLPWPQDLGQRLLFIPGALGISCRGKPWPRSVLLVGMCPGAMQMAFCSAGGGEICVRGTCGVGGVFARARPSKWSFCSTQALCTNSKAIGVPRWVPSHRRRCHSPGEAMLAAAERLCPAPLHVCLQNGNGKVPSAGKCQALAPEKLW